MIDLYTWSTPNGRKISILLEELGIEYKVFPINIMKNEQFSYAVTTSGMRSPLIQLCSDSGESFLRGISSCPPVHAGRAMPLDAEEVLPPPHNG